MAPQGFGYAVFGQLIRGMDVVRKIESGQNGAERTEGEDRLLPSLS